MNEQQLDFLKVTKMIGKCTPQQLGILMKQYYSKHLKDLPIEASPFSKLAPSLLDVFDGGIDNTGNIR